MFECKEDVVTVPAIFRIIFFIYLGVPMVNEHRTK